ncbi:hypothetical protein BEI02_13340 [Elizabethkingia sp. HvH-WGS333]|uniref:hypothetical protein n=1 Tax=Elizabethkingia TaxID=308865 RepID=UPI000741822D|nr:MULTISPECIES: hypothetical protein [Elizabethkingia]KUG11962.1 hypothetical protein AMC91_10315 [Elizabethkingia miricola]MCL1655007.1 hypothetical protein [Elizabethkingia miricola]OIK46802.1 hypothetical protein BEI02_13340 [Elizabethkingia sp. HvH-WGS333]
MNYTDSTYQLAQKALADLKSAIHILLNHAGENGLTNSEIGKTLGIYHGHSGNHEGHIPRALLEIMKTEGVVFQDASTKKWIIKRI